MPHKSWRSFCVHSDYFVLQVGLLFVSIMVGLWVGLWEDRHSRDSAPDESLVLKSRKWFAWKWFAFHRKVFLYHVEFMRESNL